MERHGDGARLPVVRPADLPGELPDEIRFGVEKGAPSGRRMSWNQTAGSGLPSFEPQGKTVWVLPLTKPQFMAPTPLALKSGRMSSKRLPAVRAMYSVQMSGRSWALSAAIRLFGLGRPW